MISIFLIRVCYYGMLLGCVGMLIGYVTRVCYCGMLVGYIIRVGYKLLIVY